MSQEAQTKTLIAAMDKVSDFEMQFIHKITAKACEKAAEYGHPIVQSSLILDVGVAHVHCPLQLDKMAQAAETGEYLSDMLHDVFGIRRHLNRATGQLEDCFLPRFALPEFKSTEESEDANPWDATHEDPRA